MIKIGVIGCGYWGPNLIRNFNEVKDASVVACVDTDEERLKYVKQRFPSVEVTSNYRDLIRRKDIDAVAISTPVSTHFSIAYETLKEDKHVLVEKPIAKSEKEAEKLVTIAEKNNVILMVGHTFEYAGAVNKIKELISNNKIGEVYYFDSTRVNLGLFQSDVNVIWDLAPHDISIMLYILNQLPSEILAVGKGYVNSNIEDVCHITTYFSSGIIGHIHVSWLAPVKFRRTVIAGSEKMIVYDDVENVEKVKVFERGVTVRKDIDSEGILGRQLIYRTGDVWSPQIDTSEPLKVECSHFIDCIKSSKKPRSDGRVGLKIVKILEAVDKSLKSGGKIVKI